MPVRRRIVVACSLLLAVATTAVIGYRTIGGPNVTWLDAVYMAVITLTGVGYSEVVESAHNPALRIFNIFIVTFGVTVAVYVFSGLTAFLVEGELRHLFRRSKMKKQISELTKHSIVCGVGETGRHVIEEFQNTKTPYVVIESCEDVVNRLRENYPGHAEMLYVIGDATDENILLQAGIERAGGLISALPSDKDNLVITVVVRQRNPAIRIVSRCTDLSFSDRLLRVGANSIVSPNHIGGLRMASEMLRPSVVSFLDLMLQEKSRTLRIEEIHLPKGSGWIGSTIGELDLGLRYNLLLLATKGRGDLVSLLQINPSGATKLSEETVMILLGDSSDLLRARADAAK